MKKIATAVAIIILICLTTSSAFANRSDEERKRRMIASDAAAKHSSITPAVLAEVKTWAIKHKAPHGEFWHADTLGIATCDSGDCTIAAWDGSIIIRSHGWGTEIKRVGSWIK